MDVLCWRPIIHQSVRKFRLIVCRASFCALPGWGVNLIILYNSQQQKIATSIKNNFNCYRQLPFFPLKW